MTTPSDPRGTPMPPTIELARGAPRHAAAATETAPSARHRQQDEAGPAGAGAAADATVRRAAGPASQDAPRTERTARDPDVIAPVVESPWERYEDLGLLGRGGMGEVRRVRDRVLGRVLAMKVIPADAAGSDTARARFLAEARLAAGLQHPGIVPVHDCGAVPDGRLWFTMKEVRGETLRAAIAEAYGVEPAGLSPAALRRLCDVYARVCEAVAYAHRHGVMHRDLKPDNVLLGEMGEVYVVDWGLARPLDGIEPEAAISGNDDERLTLAGQIIGTPAYMPPEQARGERAIGSRSDVYALGAVLYEILCGTPPYSGSANSVLHLVVNGPPDPIVWRAKARPPDELLAICERAMARDAGDRFADAGALAAEVRLFLDGARRRDRALAVLADAEAIAPRIEDLRGKARALRAEAAAILASLQTWDAAEQKARGWALEDEARAHDVAAAVERVAWETRIHVALTEAPDLHGAHEALADRYAAELLASESARDVEGAARAEALLRLHDRGRFAALLDGLGTISLATEPTGAEVVLHRYVERSRRLVAEEVGPIGRTPLRDASVPHGSYLLRVRAPGLREMRYALRIGRGERWDGTPPGEAELLAIRLFEEGALDADDVYVPAGWCAVGGDAAAGDSLAAQRVWVDGFVMRRYPVTVEEYVAFLDDLVASGRRAEAEAACPRMPTSMARNEGVPILARDAEGRFHMPADAPREHLRHPVTSVTWHGAVAYAAWRSKRDGLPWRLPSELEWEKAARGADRRFFPWGDQQESTWACMVGSASGAPALSPVDAYAADESPYGVRGLAGNVRDWCIDAWEPSGPPAPGGRLKVIAAADPDAPRSIRGGAWTAAPSSCRAAARFAGRADDRGAALGFRLARSIESEPGRR